MSFFLHLCCLLFVIFSISSTECDCLYYNKNAENVKLHFSLCDFSEIAKPKVNKIALFDPTVLLHMLLDHYK